jgi:hypothetical protein
MATIGKILGQKAPVADTDTLLYTVPADTYTITSTMFIANRGATAGNMIVYLGVAGAPPEDKQVIMPTVPVAGNDGIPLTVGLTLGAGDIVTVRASTSDFSVNLCGLEIS